MEVTRHRLRRAFLTTVPILLFTSGCGPRLGDASYDSPPPSRERPNSNVLDRADVLNPVSTMERFISNRLPGVTIRRVAGAPSIQIRGTSTFSSTNEALIMVDGRQMDTATFLRMNPADVEQIEVLRGANAAIYGRRGANGVLVVTTQ